MLWDFEIPTDKAIPVQRPDTVVIYKAKRTTAIVDVAVLLDWNVKGKKDEKILKCQFSLKILKKL